MARQKKRPQTKARKPALRSKLISAYKAQPVVFAILAAGALLAAVALIFYFAGFVKQNITGEGFYDLQFPYRNTFSESWREFFLERIRSRLMHGVLISAMFHIVGFNPPALYVTELLLIIGAAVLAALSLRRFVNSAWFAALLVMAFTWLPLNIPDLMQFKKAHHALAWFAFWLAVFLWQKWAAGRRLVWLFGCALAFLTSVLAYEVAIALLPVALFLSLPDIKSSKDFFRSVGLVIWITLLSGLAFLNLERLKPFSGVESVYAAGGWDLGNIFLNAKNFLPQLPAAIWNSALMEFPIGPAASVARIVILLCLLGGLLVLLVGLARRQNIFAEGYFAPLFAGLWLCIGAYLPFILAGQAPDGDGLRGAAFGVVLLALALAGWLAQRGLRRVGELGLAAICLFWVIAGLGAYAAGIRSSRQEDRVLSNVVHTLTQQVPDVDDGIDFVFINSSLGRTGCIGFMNMLYDKENLHCIHLLRGDRQERYTRVAEGLLEKDERFWPERFILVTFDAQGIVTILDQLDADDYSDLPITWEVSDPLQTDRSLIHEEVYPFGRNFDFYEYMLKQRPAAD